MQTLIKIYQLIFCLLLCFSFSISQAKNIEIQSVKTYSENDIYYLDASLEISLTEEANKALKHGIALEIHTQFQLLQKRQWIWDKKINESWLIYRLEHRPLTQDYLTINLKTGVRRSFDSLDAALSDINSVSRMSLFNKSLLLEEHHYLARLRTYIDLESLPTPMRPQAYFSESWDISSDWREWDIIK